MPRYLSHFFLAALLAVGCGEVKDTGDSEPEGRNAGECSDAADNDGDGLFDCNDPDCEGSPDCVEDTGTAPTDADGDGWNADDDCDDSNAAVHPGADELCDGLDNDCDGTVDEGGSSTTWTVCVDGTGSYATIQDAINDASDGDTITLCPGTYTEELNTMGVNLTLYGEDASTTALQGTGTARVLTVEYTETVYMEGLTITGGYEASDYGGAMLIDNGSAVYATDCVFEANESAKNGAAIYMIDASHLETSNCSFLNNVTAKHGGNIYSTDSTAVITDTTFTDSIHTGTGGIGGGLYSNNSTVEVYNIVISDGSGWTSGAMLETYNGTLTGWQITVQGAVGRGIDLSYTTNVDISNVIVNGCGHWGLSIAESSYSTASTELLVTNTIVVGCAAGISIYPTRVDSAKIINSISAWNTSAGFNLPYAASYEAITYSNAYGNGTDWDNLADPTGTGNLTVDPGFTNYTNDGDWTNDDFTLTSTSNCIDAGNRAAIYDDVDGSTNDIGAFGGPHGDWTP